MRPRSVIGLVVLALLGLALAAGITLAASRLTSQSVGLSGEPLGAGDELVPPVTTTERPRTRRPRTPARTHTTPARTTSTTATPPPVVTTDDHGGSDGSDDSGGRGRGHGGDD